MYASISFVAHRLVPNLDRGLMCPISPEMVEKSRRLEVIHWDLRCLVEPLKGLLSEESYCDAQQAVACACGGVPLSKILGGADGCNDWWSMRLGYREWVIRAYRSDSAAEQV